MKINKYFNAVLSAIFVMGLGMSVASCSDDDKNNSENPGGGDDNKTEAEYEQEVLGWSLITQLTDEGKAPNGWEDKTFEPTIGSAVEGDPYTRVVATNTMESAAARFAELADNPPGFSENTSAYDFSIEGIGKLSYQRGSENGQYLAQVTVDLKQVPHLKKILYQTPEQSGINGSFAGTAYYRFGDVVMDGEGYYWICVRPAFGKEGKQDNHWLCLSRTLPEKNLEPYKTSTGNQNYLPTGLGSSTKHMQNSAEMFYAMLHPDDWHNNLSGSPTPAMFDDFSTKNYQYHNIYFWQLVCKAWQDQDLFGRVLGVSKDQLDRGLSNGLHFIYSGYSWWWKTSWWCTLYEATYKNGTGKKSNMHDATTTKPQKDMHNIIVDAKTGEKVGTVNGEFFDNDNAVRWYARCKTGAQLSSNGNYNEKTAISGVQEVYVYNKLHGIDLNEEPEIATKEGDVHPNQDPNDPADKKNASTGIVSKLMKDVQRHDIGEVVAKNGRIYNSVEEAKKDGTEAVAMIAALKWESDEVSGKYTGEEKFASTMYTFLYKETTAIAIGFEDIPMERSQVKFAKDKVAYEAKNVDAKWVNEHAVPDATWYQMDEYALQRMLIECGDTNPCGDNNLIYCLDDIKKKAEDGKDDYSSYCRTPSGEACELSKKLLACGVAEFKKNAIWATSTDDVVFVLSGYNGGFDITFNLQNLEYSKHCRFYLKW